ncbi:MAG: sigma 54-interacting transcriptional regulator, partial [Planctomycetota bacterium]
EEKRILPLGDQKFYDYDARIISATNKSLSQKVAEKKFRIDLYYRLKLLYLYIPPLRERKEDIDILVNHFVEKVCKANGLRIKKIPSECIEVITNYDWPGNIRQLKNFIETLVVFAEGNLIPRGEFYKFFDRMTQEDRFFGSGEQEGAYYKGVIHLSKKDVILNALKKANGNITRAAKFLDMTRQNLYYLIKKYNIKIK